MPSSNQRQSFSNSGTQITWQKQPAGPFFPHTCRKRNYINTEREKIVLILYSFQLQTCCRWTAQLPMEWITWFHQTHYEWLVTKKKGVLQLHISECYHHTHSVFHASLIHSFGWILDIIHGILSKRYNYCLPVLLLLIYVSVQIQNGSHWQLHPWNVQCFLRTCMPPKVPIFQKHIQKKCYYSICQHQGQP